MEVHCSTRNGGYFNQRQTSTSKLNIYLKLYSGHTNTIFQIQNIEFVNAYKYMSFNFSFLYYQWSLLNQE